MDGLSDDDELINEVDTSNQPGFISATVVNEGENTNGNGEEDGDDDDNEVEESKE